MINEKITPQLFNGLFSFFNYLDTVVLWISSANYQRQLYINNAYEKVWKTSKEELQTHPEIWIDTLIPEDANLIMPELAQRSKIGNRNSTVSFRIHQPNGETLWLKSTGFTLVDENNNPTLIAGVDEYIQPTEGIKLQKQGPIVHTQHSPLTQDFLSIIQKELQLYPKNHSPNPTNNPKSIIINGKNISISPREAECLNHLTKGLSAKQTAYIMQLSTRTVEAYLNNLRKKTQVRTKIELLGKIQNYLITPNHYTHN